jgi:hypothetical protein
LSFYSQTLWLTKANNILPEDPQKFDLGPYPKDVRSPSNREDLEDTCTEYKLEMGLPSQHIHDMSPYDFSKPKVAHPEQTPLWTWEKVGSYVLFLVGIVHFCQVKCYSWIEKEGGCSYHSKQFD